MWFTHLRLAARLLRRDPLISCINVAGLSAAIAVCALALLYVRHETSYDAFHAKADRLHVIYLDPTSAAAASESYGGRSTMMRDAALRERVQQNVAGLSRSSHYALGWPQVLQGEEGIYEGIAAVGPDFLEMFTFPLEVGQRSAALANPKGIVLTHETALKYFGRTQVLGETVSLKFRRLDTSVRPPQEHEVVARRTVTGVLAPIPDNSSLYFSMLVPEVLAEEIGFRGVDAMFVELAAGVWAADVEAQMASLAQTQFEGRQRFCLLPLREVYMGQTVAR